MIRLALIVLAAAVGTACTYAETVCLDSMAAVPASPCGVWTMTADGALFSLVPVEGGGGTLEMRLLSSPDLSIEPGAVAGRFFPTVKPTVYDVKMARRPAKDTAHLPMLKRTFTAEFDTDMQRMTLRPYSQSWTVDILRLVPYIFRMSVRRSDTRPDDIDGAFRIAPAVNTKPVIL